MFAEGAKNDDQDSFVFALFCKTGIFFLGNNVAKETRVLFIFGENDDTPHRISTQI